MRRAIRHACLVWTLACTSLLGCGPGALRPRGEGPTLAIGDQSLRIETLTDLEEVRAVAEAQGIDYVATDRGLFAFATAVEAPEPEQVQGLPSQDVRGLAEDDGALLVATAAGLVSVRGQEVTPVAGVPDVGVLMDFTRASDGTIWLCGLGGVARRREGSWEVFGAPARCTTLAPTPEGQLWIGTTAGLLYVEGDVVREHPISGGIPEGYVRSIVPVLPGQIMAIVQGPSDSQIAFWDSERWHGYTVRGLEGAVVGLVRRGGEVILVSQDRLLALSPRGQGVGLIPISSAEGTVRSFRATMTPAAEHRPGEPVDREVIKEPTRLARVPDRPPPAAPPFVARPLSVELPGRIYRAFVAGDQGLLAIANGGLLHLRERGTRRLMTRSLVPEGDLQIAVDGRGTTWVLARGGELARFAGGRLRRTSVPEGIVPQAIASGRGSAILVALEPAAGPSAIRIFTNTGAGWQSTAQRSLQLPTRLLGIPFAGVAPDGAIWAALRVEREDGGGARVRGVAVIDPSSEAIAYHHRGATEGGLPLPDEVSAMDFDGDGNAWLASLSGVVRLGNSQAVVFGETRGVRGEVVTDCAVGDDVVWVASAEGVGAYDRTRFDYAQPEAVQRARPTMLAIDLQGTLWATSRAGLAVRRAGEWTILGTDAGLPEAELVDVETDREGRVWLLASDRLIVLDR